MARLELTHIFLALTHYLNSINADKSLVHLRRLALPNIFLKKIQKSKFMEMLFQCSFYLEYHTTMI